MSPGPLPEHTGNRMPSAPKSRAKKKSCPFELVTTVPVVIVSLLIKAAWRRVRR